MRMVEQWWRRLKVEGLVVVVVEWEGGGDSGGGGGSGGVGRWRRQTSPLTFN